MAPRIVYRWEHQSSGRGPFCSGFDAAYTTVLQDMPPTRQDIGRLGFDHERHAMTFAQAVAWALPPCDVKRLRQEGQRLMAVSVVGITAEGQHQVLFDSTRRLNSTPMPGGKPWNA